jgi:hypothetical protein
MPILVATWSDYDEFYLIGVWKYQTTDITEIDDWCKLYRKDRANVTITHSYLNGVIPVRGV